MFIIKKVVEHEPSTRFHNPERLFDHQSFIRLAFNFMKDKIADHQFIFVVGKRQ